VRPPALPAQQRASRRAANHADTAPIDSPGTPKGAALVYGRCSTHVDTLLPGYVSRPHPSPINCLLPRRSAAADSTGAAPGSRRTLRFSDSAAAATDVPPGGSGSEGACGRKVPGGSVLPAADAEEAGAAAHERKCSWNGYGVLEPLTSNAGDSTEAHNSAAVRASAKSQELLAGLQMDLDAGALQNGGEKAEADQADTNVGGSRGSGLAEPGSAVAARACALQAKRPDATLAVATLGGGASASAAEHLRAPSDSQTQRASPDNASTAHPSCSGTHRNDGHGGANLGKALLGTKVSEVAHTALCTMPLPTSLDLSTRLFAALCALYGWLQVKHVQVCLVTALNLLVSQQRKLGLSALTDYLARLH
jgi:hypothetical protein